MMLTRIFCVRLFEFEHAEISSEKRRSTRDKRGVFFVDFISGIIYHYLDWKKYYSMSEFSSKKNGILPAMLEAMLFSASSPVTVAQLAEAAGHSVSETESGLKELENHYSNDRGLKLQWHHGKVQLTTAPEYAEQVEMLLGLEAYARLSRAGIETLAIIAYRQPITRPSIDAIRGVNSDGVLKSLLMKGVVEEVGRADGPGRPILYGTTNEFLQLFGLNSLNELPPFETAIGPEGEVDKNPILKD